ncbi:MAG: Uncharacterised protein [Opitutia bacterium UBA7350]|nr:MAG: Uncharacterised protein [Opitutae bacterium UBA7350]
MAQTPAQFTLVIDTSNPVCFAGILDAKHHWLAYQSNEGPALEILFSKVETVLTEAELSLNEITSYLYCEGPGSTLGLRLAAMAIKTWRALHVRQPPCFAYHSLQLAAHCLKKDQPKLLNALIVADWKKDTWNAVFIKQGVVATGKTISQAKLEAWQGSVYHLPQRKGWQAPPSDAITMPYTPERIHELIDAPRFLRPVDIPVPFASAPSNFQKWIPDRHRAFSPDA